MKLCYYPVAILVVAASLAAPFWVRHHSGTRLEELQNLIGQQAQEIARLSQASLPASPKVNQTTSRLSDDQLRELLRLRAEAGQLRAAVAETKKLRASIQPGSRLPTVPTQAAGPDYWPVDQLINSGFATPEDSLKTFLWSLKNSDLNSFISCMAPDQREQFEFQIQKGPQEAARLQSEFKTATASLISGTSACSVVAREEQADGGRKIQLSCEGEGVVMEFAFKKFGSDWKLQQMGPPRFTTSP